MSELQMVVEVFERVQRQLENWNLGIREGVQQDRPRAVVDTAVALVYQSAETTKMARGRGTDSPNVRQASV